MTGAFRSLGMGNPKRRPMRDRNAVYEGLLCGMKLRVNPAGKAPTESRKERASLLEWL